MQTTTIILIALAAVATGLMIWKGVNLREAVQGGTGFTEFLADHFNETAGHILIKASPLLAPLPSAIAIYGALHERFGTVPALIVTAVVEGLGFAAVDARNRIEEHNRTSSEADRVDPAKSRNAVTMYFIVSLSTILAFETVPAWGLYLHGTTGYTIIDAITHTAPIVFPFFSNIGASIYSLMDVLNGLQKRTKETVDEQLATTKAEAAKVVNELTERVHELQAAQADLIHELQVSKEASTRLSEQVTEQRQMLAVRETELRMLQAQFSSVSDAYERLQERGVQPSRTPSRKPSRTPVRTATPNATFERRVALVDLFKANGSLSLSEAAEQLGAGKTTVSNDLNWLSNNEVIKKWTDPETGKTAVQVNGKEPAFRRGEIG